MRLWTVEVEVLFFLKCLHRMVKAVVPMWCNYLIGVVVARKDIVRCILAMKMKIFSFNFTITFVDLIHITCQSSSSFAKDDLAEYVEKLYKNHYWQEPDEVVNEASNPTEDSKNPRQSKPRILWSMYFNIPICLKCEYADETPIPGLHLSCGPYFELDYDKSIEDVSKYQISSL